MRQIYLAILMLGTMLFTVAPPRARADDRRGLVEHSFTLDVAFDWSHVPSYEKLSSWLLSKGHLSYPLIFYKNKFVGLVPTRLLLPKEQRINLQIGISQFLERPLYDVYLAETSNTSNAYEVKIIYPALSLQDDGNSIGIETIITDRKLIQSEDNRYLLTLPAEPYAVISEFANGQIDKTSRNYSIPVVHIANHQALPPVDWRPYEKPSYQINKYKLAPGDDFEYTKQIYEHNIQQGWAESVLLFARPPCPGCDVLASIPETSYFNPLKWFEIEPRDRLLLSSSPEDAEIIYSGSRLPDNTDNEVEIPKSEWSTIVLRKNDFLDCAVDVNSVTPPVKAEDPSKFTCNLKPIGALVAK